MKKYNSPTKLLLGFLGIATFASLVGTVSGTLAWYAYSTRAIAAYSGTSVASTKNLQIGIASDVQLDNIPSSIQEVVFQDQYDSENSKFTNYYYFATTDKILPSSGIQLKKKHILTIVTTTILLLLVLAWSQLLLMRILKDLVLPRILWYR